MKFMAAICLLATSASSQVGYSGIVSADGKNVQFKQDFAHGIVLIGPSGIVVKDRNNLQLTGDHAALYAASPSVPQPMPQLFLTRSVVGRSGIVSPAENIQFTQDMVGPSGILTKSGKKIQFNDQGPPLTKPSAGFALLKGNLGHSGIVRADSTFEQFSHALADNIMFVGHSGIVNKDNKDIQMTSDLHRVKRSLVSPSGMILKDGTPVQFKTPFATVFLDGLTGMVFSDGTLLQKRSKRNLVGPSGMITADGTPI